MSAARAFALRGRWYTDGPDFIDVPCVACKHLVESVDSHGTCDDCARERDAADDATDAAEIARCEAELAADDEFNTLCSARAEDAVRHAAVAHDAFRLAVLVGQISYVRRVVRPVGCAFQARVAA